MWTEDNWIIGNSRLIWFCIYFLEQLFTFIHFYSSQPVLPVVTLFTYNNIFLEENKYACLATHFSNCCSCSTLFIIVTEQLCQKWIQKIECTMRNKTGEAIFSLYYFCATCARDNDALSARRQKMRKPNNVICNAYVFIICKKDKA